MEKQLSNKQRAHIEKLRVSGHYSRAGKIGGKNNATKRGPEGMAELGHRGAQSLRSRFASPEEEKAYYSRIGSMKRGGANHE